MVRNHCLLSDDGEDNYLVPPRSQADTIFWDGTNIFTRSMHSLTERGIHHLCVSARLISDHIRKTVPYSSSYRQHMPLNPDGIFLDFGSTVRNVAETLFLNVNIKSCLFHHCQRVGKRVYILDAYTNDHDY